jgi:hypothetical protein
MVKHLHYLFTLLLVMLCTAATAQTTVTFQAGTDKGSDGGTAAKDVALTKDGITLHCTLSSSNAGVLGRTDNYRFYQNSKLEVSSTVGNITKVVFTCTAKDTAKYGPGNFTGATTGSYTYEEAGETGTWTGDAAEFTLTASKNQVRATKIEVTYTPSGKTSADLSFPEATYTVKLGDSFTAPTLTNPHNLTVSYTVDNTDVADVDATTGEVTINAAGTAKITASTEGNDTYAAGSASYTLTVTGDATTTGDGTEAKPYTVADILALNAANALPTDEVYVKGIVSQIKEVSASFGNATYYISDDGTTTNQFQIYRGKYLNNVKFTSEDQLQTGWTVTVKGKVTLFNTSLEMAQNNYLTSIEKPAGAAPAISGDETFLESTTVTITANQEGATVYYTTDGTTPTDKSTKYTEPITLTETTTVKAIAYLNGTASEVAEKTFTKTEPISVAKALEILANGTQTTSNVYVSGTIVEVSELSTQYGNASYTISDDATSTSTLTVFRGKYLGNAKFTAEDHINAGDKVVVCGVLKNYAKDDTTTPQLTNSYLVSINGTTTAINSVKTKTALDGAIYNLAGQRVSKSYKGVVIKNGRKYIVK